MDLGQGYLIAQIIEGSIVRDVLGGVKHLKQVDVHGKCYAQSTAHHHTISSASIGCNRVTHLVAAGRQPLQGLDYSSRPQGPLDLLYRCIYNKI